MEALQRIVATHNFDTGEPAIELPDAVLRQLNNEFFKKMDALRRQYVYPVLVFDGKSMPTKDATRRKRQECVVCPVPRPTLRCVTLCHTIIVLAPYRDREIALRDTKSLLERGMYRDARRKLASVFGISHTTRQFIVQNARMGEYDYIVAPFEADAQCAFLSRSRYCAATMTEDSDFLVFGSRRVRGSMQWHGRCSVLTCPAWSAGQILCKVFGAARQRGVSRRYTHGQMLMVADALQADGDRSLGLIPQQLVSVRKQGRERLCGHAYIIVVNT